MSLPIDVSDLIHQKKVERTRIEYKSGWNPEPIIHTITAFANDLRTFVRALRLLFARLTMHQNSLRFMKE